MINVVAIFTLIQITQLILYGIDNNIQKNEYSNKMYYDTEFITYNGALYVRSLRMMTKFAASALSNIILLFISLAYDGINNLLSPSFITAWTILFAVEEFFGLAFASRILLSKRLLNNLKNFGSKISYADYPFDKFPQKDVNYDEFINQYELDYYPNHPDYIILNWYKNRYLKISRKDYNHFDLVEIIRIKGIKSNLKHILFKLRLLCKLLCESK